MFSVSPVASAASSAMAVFAAHIGEAEDIAVNVSIPAKNNEMISFFITHDAPFCAL